MFWDMRKSNLIEVYDDSEKCNLIFDPKGGAIC
jgi:hypothetical protein